MCGMVKSDNGDKKRVHCINKDVIAQLSVMKANALELQYLRIQLPGARTMASPLLQIISPFLAADDALAATPSSRRQWYYVGRSVGSSVT